MKRLFRRHKLSSAFGICVTNWLLTSWQQKSNPSASQYRAAMLNELLANLMEEPSRRRPWVWGDPTDAKQELRGNLIDAKSRHDYQHRSTGKYGIA
eukprot:5865046-Amphidinium_carterae.1